MSVTGFNRRRRKLKKQKEKVKKPKVFKPNFEDMTKDDLYKLAQAKDIDGRTKLDKKGLIEALKAEDK